VLLTSPSVAGPVNIGSGTSYTIRELAALVSEVVEYRGDIAWDTSRPDGAPAKQLESSVIRQLGWQPRTSLRDGLTHTYQWFLEHAAESARRVGACASS